MDRSRTSACTAIRSDMIWKSTTLSSSRYFDKTNPTPLTCSDRIKNSANYIRSFVCFSRSLDFIGKLTKRLRSFPPLKLILLHDRPSRHSLQTGISVGRSNIKTVADKRLPEVKKFLLTLLHSAPEIVNSDLVITFFHPLLRDQQEADIHAVKMRESRPTSEANICGEVKFSIHYHRGTFIVMVRHK